MVGSHCSPLVIPFLLPRPSCLGAKICRGEDIEPKWSHLDETLFRGLLACSSGCLGVMPLYRRQLDISDQNRAAIDHKRLTGAETFLHQEHVGLCDVMRFPDSAHGQTLPNAFVQVFPLVCTHVLPEVCA